MCKKWRLLTEIKQICFRLWCCLIYWDELGLMIVTICYCSELFLSLTCSWIRDFPTNRPQTVNLSPHLSSSRTLSTGSAQSCALSPLLYSLYTHDCSPAYPGNTIIKFADDTTVIGLITGGDETNYRNEVLKLTEWCSGDNLLLNSTKMSQMWKKLAPAWGLRSSSSSAHLDRLQVPFIGAQWYCFVCWCQLPCCFIVARPHGSLWWVDRTVLFCLNYIRMLGATLKWFISY